MYRADLSCQSSRPGRNRPADGESVPEAADRRAAYCVWPDGSAREETVSTPQVPSGPARACARRIAERRERAALDGARVCGRPRAPHGARGNVRGRRRARDLRRHDVRLPDPRVPRAEQAQLRGAERAVGVRVRARARRVPPARAGGRPRASRPGACAASAADRSCGAPGLLGGVFSLVLALGDHRARAHDRDRAATSSTATSGCSSASSSRLFTFGIEFLARGAFAGIGRFGAYGLSLGAEGVIRLAAVHPARDRGRHEPVLVRPVPGGPAAARDRRRDVRAEGSRAARARPRRGRSCRATSGTCSADRCSRRCSATRRSSARRCSPSPTQRAAVADFIVGLFLSRLPILLFQAVQAALLPKLSTLVSAGRDDEFQNGVRKLVLHRRRASACSAWSSAERSGRSSGRILFGNKFNLGNADVALLAAGQRAVHPGAHAVAGAHRAVRPPPGDGGLVRRAARVRRRDRGRDRTTLFLRVELGSIAGAGVSAAAMGLFFLHRLSRGVEAGSLASLVEQIEYGTLEI